MIEKSRLQIPRPYARPGEEPDFSFLELSPAGAVDKPPIGSRTRDIEFLSSGLVRVLDDERIVVTAIEAMRPDLRAITEMIEAIELEEGDLVVSVNRRATPHVTAYREVLASLGRGQSAWLYVHRPMPARSFLTRVEVERAR